MSYMHMHKSAPYSSLCINPVRKFTNQTQWLYSSVQFKMKEHVAFIWRVHTMIKLCMAVVQDQATYSSIALAINREKECQVPRYYFREAG